jgi:hypothetical protein
MTKTLNNMRSLISRPICPKIQVRLINYIKNYKVDTNIEYSNTNFLEGHSNNHKLHQSIKFLRLPGT